MSQVSRRSEVGNKKKRSLNTQLSSGTSAGTFAFPAGPLQKMLREEGTKNKPNRYFVPDRKNGLKINPHVSNLRSREFLFQVHPQGGVGYFSNGRGFSVASSLQRISSKVVLWKRNDSSVVLYT